MPRASQHFFTRQEHRPGLTPCGAACSLRLPARAQHCMIMRAHARSSHAGAQELLDDMRWSPGAGGEELDEHEAVWILWQQTRHPSRAHGLRHGRWGPSRMGCSTAHLARQAASKDVPARLQASSCGSKLPHRNWWHSVSTQPPECQQLSMEREGSDVPMSPGVPHV